MGSNLRILYQNLWSAPATAIVASSSLVALPASASQNPQRTYVYRSLEQSGEQALDVDLGSVQPVTAIAVANVRLLAGGALILQHRGDASSPGTAVDVVTLPAQDQDVRTSVAFPIFSAHRHWRLRWTNPGAVTDYAEVGYVFLGTYWEAPTNFRVPASTGYLDPSVASTSLDGQQDFGRRTGVHTASLSFTAVSEAQRATLRAVYRQLGRRTPAFFILDTNLSWMQWLARFASPMSSGLSVAKDRFDMGFDLEEAR